MPSPPGTKALAAFGVLFCAAVTGAVLATLDKNPFWFLVAMWTVALTFSVASRGRMEMGTSLICLTLAVLPFAVGLAAASLGGRPFPMDPTGFQLLSSVSLFALCLATSLYIGTLSTLCVNRKFVVGLSLVIYVALLTVRGPIGYYGDLMFRTEHLLGNSSLMANLIFGSFIGLLLALGTNRRLRRSADEELAAAAEGGASP